MLYPARISRAGGGSTQRESSVKTFRFPFSAEFWRHCMSLLHPPLLAELNAARCLDTKAKKLKYIFL